MNVHWLLTVKHNVTCSTVEFDFRTRPKLCDPHVQFKEKESQRSVFTAHMGPEGFGTAEDQNSSQTYLNYKGFVAPPIVSTSRLKPFLMFVTVFGTQLTLCVCVTMYIYYYYYYYS